MDFKLNKNNLNFRVYTASAVPSTGNENDIVVISDVPMKNWVMSPAAPKGVPRNDGDVWITYSVTDNTFNALKNGAMLIATISAYQYVDGVWARMEAKSHRNGEWVEWWDGTLYDAGNEYEHYTGGWTSGNVSSSSTAKGSTTKNADNIQISNASSASNGAYTINAIDLTNYTKLKAIYSGNTPTLRVAPDYPASSATASVKGSNVGDTKTELTLDISGLTGMYRPALACSTQYKIYLYKMWLE